MTQGIRVAGRSSRDQSSPSSEGHLNSAACPQRTSSTVCARAEGKEMRGEVGVAGSLPAKRHESNSRECPPTCNSLVCPQAFYSIHILAPPVKKSHPNSLIKDLLRTNSEDWNYCKPNQQSNKKPHLNCSLYNDLVQRSILNILGS